MVDIAGIVPLRRETPWARWRSRRVSAPARHTDGSRATAAALTGLEPDRWRVLSDVDLPGPGAPRVDHLVVGPPGVLVVGSRSWNGAVRTAQGVLRQDGARRERDLEEAAAAAEAVRAAYELDEDVPVVGVLCFVPPAMVTGWIGRVLLCATGDVVAVLDRLARRLDREQVAELAARLTSAAGPAAVPVLEPVLEPVEPQAGA